MAMFVLEAGGQDPQFTRERQSAREACRIIATVCGSDPRSLAHWIIYIRDMNDGHLGFISQSNLPIGQTVVLNCATCTARSYRVTPQTTYFIGANSVTLAQLNTFVSANGRRYLTIFVKPDESAVTRIVVAAD